MSVGRTAPSRRTEKILFRSASGNAAKRKVPRRKGEHLFGVAPCFAAMQAGRRRVYNVLLAEGMALRRGSDLKRKVFDEVQRFALRCKVDIYHVDKGVLERLSGNRPHQGIILDVSPLKMKSLDPEDCSKPLRLVEKEGTRYPIWLALDQVQDPMNFGALLRCAFFLGVEKVLATAKKSCCLSPVVSKASAGAMELMPVHSVKNMSKFLNACAEDGWDVLGTCSPRPDHSDSSREKRPIAPVVSCRQYSLQRPAILVLGNEAHGLRAPVEEVCTTMLTIDPHRQLPLGFDSLNVGVAAGVLLHCLQTQPHS